MDFVRKPNAFVEPNNPAAVFPQIAKPDIHDFRSHKMPNGGLAAIGVFRKHLSDKTEKSKYPTIVKTSDMLAAEEAEEANKMNDLSSEDEAPQVAISAPKAKTYTIADIMTLDKSLKLTKRKGGEAAATAVEEASKGIRKKKKVKHAKKSQKIVKF